MDLDALAAQLKAAIVSVVAKIADAAINVKPTYSVEGQSFSWQEYLKMLLDSLKALFEALSMVDPGESRMQIY